MAGGLRPQTEIPCHWGLSPSPTGVGDRPQTRGQLCLSPGRRCVTLRPCRTRRRQLCIQRVWRNARRWRPASTSSTTALPTPGSRRLARLPLSAGLSWALPGSRPSGCSLPTAVFAALAAAHARVLRQRESARRAAGFYRRGLARIEGRWHGTGSEGLTHLPDEHPYAADLDLFGHGSLFQLVSSARLGGGEQLLARWLLHAARAGRGPPPSGIGERAQASSRPARASRARRR